jgi:hypothetical protein
MSLLMRNKWVRRFGFASVAALGLFAATVPTAPAQAQVGYTYSGYYGNPYYRYYRWNHGWYHHAWYRHGWYRYGWYR